MRLQVLNWLENPSPNDPQFSIAWGLAELTEPLPEENLTTGIVCCIAGWVALQSGLPPGQDESTDWDRIRDIALEQLQLPNQGHWAFGHPLFDPDLASHNCTRQRAARAARFAFENPNHEDPWNHEHEHEHS